MKIIIAATALSALLTSCNTVSGLGQDVSTLGQKVETTAEQAR